MIRCQIDRRQGCRTEQVFYRFKFCQGRLDDFHTARSNVELSRSLSRFGLYCMTSSVSQKVCISITLCLSAFNCSVCTTCYALITLGLAARWASGMPEKPGNLSFEWLQLSFPLCAPCRYTGYYDLEAQQEPAMTQTTVIGSFPNTEPGPLCARLVDSLSIPAWPQLPRRSFKENMYVQYSARLPGLQIDEVQEKVYFDTTGDMASIMPCWPCCPGSGCHGLKDISQARLAWD
jgi:hypothetical protein